MAPGAVALAQPQATPFVRQQQQDLVRAVRAGASTAELDAKVKQLLDFGRIAELSLDGEWATRTPAQRQEFTELLAAIIAKSYREQLRSLVDYQVQYQQEEPMSDGRLVHTLSRSRKNPRKPPVDIDYRVVKVGDQWRVVDVITDGASMVRSYRTQFRRIIRKSGWDDLIQRMRDRLNS